MSIPRIPERHRENDADLDARLAAITERWRAAVHSSEPSTAVALAAALKAEIQYMKIGAQYRAEDLAVANQAVADAEKTLAAMNAFISGRPKPKA
jgi:hypothetical protein